MKFQQLSRAAIFHSARDALLQITVPFPPFPSSILFPRQVFEYHHQKARGNERDIGFTVCPPFFFLCFFFRGLAFSPFLRHSPLAELLPVDETSFVFRDDYTPLTIKRLCLFNNQKFIALPPKKRRKRVCLIGFGNSRYADMFFRMGGAC